VTATAPPRPPRPSDPVTHGEVDALVEALIEEARRRGQRRRRRNVAIVTLVALVGVGLFALLGQGAQSQDPSPAHSARSNLAAAAPTSKIAFISEPGLGGGYCGTVWLMSPDGSERRRLTSRGTSAGCWQELDPAWSPDGRRIAFTSGPPPGVWSGPPQGIYIMNSDGSGERMLTRGLSRSPAWSPDGRRIAFTRIRTATSADEIDVVNANGIGQRRLALGTSPVWSPDGRRIAFVGSARRGEHNWEIHVMNADGSEQRRLTRNTVQDSDPVGRPTGGESCS
jgi:TolB protein